MNKKSGNKLTGKRWVHPPSSLTNGHVVYNVKLLGHTEVEQAKGADVVREAVRKLKQETQGFHRKIQFAKQLKRAEGEKPPKVELTISSMGVTIQDKQTKARLETFPLHRISYCADDKQDKRICAFICKQDITNKNICFVMDSDKCAEEITLTVGQAFDLAYQQFMQTSGKTIGSQVQALQKKVRELETENTKLRMRIVELEARQGVQPPSYSESNSQAAASQPAQLKDLMGSPTQLSASASPFQYQTAPPSAGALPPYSSPPTAAVATTGPQASSPAGMPPEAGATNGLAAPASGETVQSPASPTGTSVTSRPRPHGISTPSNQDSPLPSLAPPPALGRSRRQTVGTTPVPRQDSQGSNGSYDPFGQAPFSQPQPLGATRSNPFLAASSGSTQDLDMQRLQEIQEGFASGLTIGNEDLSWTDLDPLKNLSNC